MRPIFSYSSEACVLLLILSMVLMLTVCNVTLAGAQEITGVTIENFSSQLPGSVQPCCNRRAIYMLTDLGLNVNGPGTMTTVPDPPGDQNQPGYMWLSDDNPNIASQYITFDLEGVYELDGTRIWNYNEVNLLNRGVYQMEILVSKDNVTYRNLGVYTLAMAPNPASAYRDFSEYIPLFVSDVRYVKFQILSSWGDTNYVGLSKVRFVAAPAAKSPVSSGLIMHLDASDANADGSIVTEPANGSALTTWADKSGQGNNATAANGAPTYIRDRVNGHPAVRFDGNDEFALPNFSGLAAGEIFVVVRTDMYPPTAPNVTGLWRMGTHPWATHYTWFDAPNNAVRLYDSFGTDVRKDYIDTKYPLDQWNVYNARSAPNAWDCWLNGLQLYSTGANTVDFPGNPSIGADSQRGVYLVGDIAEVLMYSRSLSAGERVQVTEYLQRKYNVRKNYNDSDNRPPVREGITIHLDAKKMGQYGNGAALVQWQDRSGNSFRASTSNDPVWARSSMGGNPGVRFNGNDEYTLGNLASAFPSGATVFVATSLNDAAYNLFDTLNNDPWWRYHGNGLSYMGAYRASRLEGFTSMPSSGQYVYTIESTGSFWQMYQDNVPRGSVSALYSPGNDYRVSGAYGAGDKFLNGDIAELIVYDRALSAEKRSKVGAYLREKYRVNTTHSDVPVTRNRVFHIAADAIPDAVDGGVIGVWPDISGNGFNLAQVVGNPKYYHNRVNGKPVVRLDGGADGSGDSLRFNVATNQQMTIFAVSRGTNYQSMVRWQPGDWLVYPWGNGDLIQTQNGNTGGGINAGLVPDEWNVSTALIATGVANGVRTYRNGQLRGQMTYGASWFVPAPLWIGSIGGGGEWMTGDIAEVIIYHRALNDTERRLVESFLMKKYGLDGAGPGGLHTADLEVWLRADRDVKADANGYVYEWGDQSGFNRYIYQDASAQRPDWVTNSVNGLPVVRFNPNGGATNAVEYFKTDTYWPSGTTGASVFIVAKSNVNDTFGYQSIVRYQQATYIIYPWVNQFIIALDGGTTTGVSANLDPLQWNVGGGTYRANTANGFQTFKNSALVSQRNSANIVLESDLLLIGAYGGGDLIPDNNESPNADVGEIAVYSSRINEAKRVLLENYLSARFNKPLAQNDLYLGDEPAQGDYDWGVAGIGRLGNPVDFGDGGNPFGAGVNLNGRSGGLVIEESSFLKDSGDFLVAGHNGLPNQLTNADLVGTGAQNRWSRIWYLQKSDAGGNAGQVMLHFNPVEGEVAGAQSGDMLLLRRAGASGNFTAVATSAAPFGGQYPFTLNTATLSNGYYTVAERDTIPPVITLTDGDMEIECADGYSEPGYTATDNSDGNLAGSVVITGTVFANQRGTYILRYNVSDTAGNAATERTRTVTVVDTTKPTIVLEGDNPAIVECRTPYDDDGATASDACAGDLTASISTTGLPINTNSTGTHTVTYNVSDVAGNVADTVSRTVNVVDTTPPVLTVFGTGMTLECGVDTFLDPGAEAADACAGPVPVVVGGDAVDEDNTGTYVITYNATDGANAAPQQTRTVTVQDTLGPEIELNGSANMTVLRFTFFLDPGATATDACEGDVSGSVIVTGSVNTNNLGPQVLTYNVSDGGSRPATPVTRTVTVVAGNAPVITLVGGPEITLECGGGPYDDDGAVATDVEDDDAVLTANIVTGGLPIDTNSPDTYIVTYNVTDSNGNPATEVTRTVIVEDTQAPQLTLLGNAVVDVACGGVYNDAGASATDSCDDDATLSAQIQATGLPINTGNPGSYTVTYRVVDSSGNQAAPITRTVNVQDTLPPSITLAGNPYEVVYCGDTYSDAGALASDVCDDDEALTGSIVVTGLPIDTGTPGIYTVTYNVADVSGNSAVPVSRTVEVVDNEPPVISLNGPPKLQIVLNGTYNELGASATDACAGDLPVVIGGQTVDTATKGTYIVTYNAVDPSGNAADEVTREVVVTEGVTPFIVEHPIDVLIAYGEDAEFVISAIGLDVLTYQWLRNGVPLEDNAKYQGVLTDTLQVLNVANADEGAFRCRVTSVGALTTSLPGNLIVSDPGILTQPASKAVAPGDSAQFSVSAAGSGTLTYAWYHRNAPLSNGGGISGADTNTLTVGNAQRGINDGEYYVVVTGADGLLESDRATLTVGNPIVVKHPESLIVPRYTDVSFEIEAVGVPPLLYRWRKDGVNLSNGGRISGVSTPTLSIASVLESDQGDYSCRVVGQNVVESNQASLTVLGPPIIEGVRQLPDSGVVPVQGPAAITVLVTGGATPFSYQWRKDGEPISDTGRITGANTATLNIATAERADAGVYDCIVSNSVESEQSPSAQFRVGLTITRDLFPKLVEEYDRLSWSIGVGGAYGALEFQWMREMSAEKLLDPLQDFGSISGTATDTLVIDPVLMADAGLYTVVVSDELESTMSSTVQLTVVENLAALSRFGLLLLVALFSALLGALARHNRVSRPVSGNRR